LPGDSFATDDGRRAQQGLQGVGDVPGLLGHLAPGEAGDGVAGEAQLGVAPAIGRERSPARVMFEAVSLGDEPLLRPEEVDRVRPDDRLAARSGDPVATQESEEAALEHACWVGRVADQRGA